MTTGAAAEWERKHSNGWVAAVSIASDGSYHYRARNTVDESVAVASRSGSDLPGAQAAADRLVPPHECHCPEWIDVAAKLLVQVKCAADHDIAATYAQRELEEGLSSGSLTFYCSRCNTHRPPTPEERATMLRRLQDRMP